MKAKLLSILNNKKLYLGCIGLLLFVLGLTEQLIQKPIIYIIGLLTFILFYKFRDRENHKVDSKSLRVPLLLLGLFSFFMVVSPQIDLPTELEPISKLAYFLVFPFIFFFLGLYLKIECSIKTLLILLYCYLLGAFCLGIINVLYTYAFYKDLLTSRSIYNIIQHTSQGITHLTIWIMPVVITNIVLLFLKGIKPIIRILAGLVSLSLLVLSAIVENRGFFFVLAVALIVELFVMIFVLKDKKKKKLATYAFGIILLLGLVFCAMVVFNLFNFKSWAKDIPLLRRFTNTSDLNPRLYNLYDFFSQCLTHPFGGIVLEHSVWNYAHMDMLDVYKIGGFIPFFAYIILFELALFNLSLKNKKRRDTISNILLLTLLVVKIAVGIIEPTIYTSNTYFEALFTVIGFSLIAKKD